jgi:hypothetical protein
MAKIPLLLHVSAASQALPLVTYLAARNRSRPAALLAAGAGISAAANVAARMVAVVAGNNHVVSYISSAATGALFLLALRDWQLTARERRAFQVATLVFVVVWVALVAFVEDMREFDRVTAPMYSLTLLAAGTWTLLRRANVSEATPLTQSDWFWVCSGTAVYGAATALAAPIGAILITRQRFDLFDIAWQVRAALSTLGFLLMSWGIYRGPTVSKYATVE